MVSMINILSGYGFTGTECKFFFSLMLLVRQLPNINCYTFDFLCLLTESIVGLK